MAANLRPTLADDRQLCLTRVASAFATLWSYPMTVAVGIDRHLRTFARASSRAGVSVRGIRSCDGVACTPLPSSIAHLAFRSTVNEGSGSPNAPWRRPPQLADTSRPAEDGRRPARAGRRAACQRPDAAAKALFAAAAAARDRVVLVVPTDADVEQLTADARFFLSALEGLSEPRSSARCCRSRRTRSIRIAGWRRTSTSRRRARARCTRSATGTRAAGRRVGARRCCRG